MTKDRKRIAKGSPRNRHLCDVDDIKDKKRYLTYSSKGKAESAFITSGFYSNERYELEDLEAVEVDFKITMTDR